MIYLISGKMQSGKDTVAKIWQMLSQGNKPYEIIHDLQQPINTISSTWQIKHYGHKLKEVCALLTGTKVEQWYDETFKNTPLPEIWNKWAISMEDEHHKYHVIDYAVTYELACCNQYHGNIKIEEVRLTPRLFMQLVGTECFRNIIHPNTWINALYADYTPTPTNSFGNRQPDDLDDMPISYPDWLVPDTRFPNELLIPVGQFGAKSIRVERYRTLDQSYIHFGSLVKLEGNGKVYTELELLELINYTVDAKHLHTSEIALDKATFDYRIIAYDLSDLIKQTMDIMEKEGVL